MPDIFSFRKEEEKESAKAVMLVINTTDKKQIV